MNTNISRQPLSIVQAAVGPNQTENAHFVQHTQRRVPVLTPLLEALDYGTGHLRELGIKAKQAAESECLLPSHKRLEASFSAAPGHPREVNLQQCGLTLSSGGILYFLTEYDKSPDKLNPVALRLLHRIYLRFSGAPMVCPTDTAKALKKRMFVVHPDKTAHLQERSEWSLDKKMHAAMCIGYFEQLFFVLERLHSMLENRAFTEALYAPGRENYGRLRMIQEGLPCLAGVTAGLTAFFFGRSGPRQSPSFWA